MTQSFGTNAANDLYLGPGGNLVVLSGLDAVMAACASATKAQLGEMVLATTSGIPNFQAIWVGTPNYAIWRQYLIDTLQGIDGVTQVQSLTFSARNNTLSYVATISTIYGTGTLTV